MHSADFFRSTSPRLILEDYLDVNADVASRDTLLQLAPFALYKKVRAENLTRMFTLNPRTPYRHRSWFIWNALRLTGLEEHWYAYEYNRSLLSWADWVKRIRATATKEQEQALCNLLYVKRIAYQNPTRTVRTGTLWTKGGGWDSRIGITKILVLNEHIDRPDCWYKNLIGEHHLQLVEDELMVVCDPDKDIMPTQFYRAIQYARVRMRDFTGKPMSLKWLAWFFQTNIPDGKGDWWLKNRGVMRTRMHTPIDW